MIASVLITLVLAVVLSVWALDQNEAARHPDYEEAGYRLNRHRFVEGEYVTIQDKDEKRHRFEVVAVRSAGHAVPAEGKLP